MWNQSAVLVLSTKPPGHLSLHKITRTHSGYISRNVSAELDFSVLVANDGALWRVPSVPWTFWRACPTRITPCWCSASTSPYTRAQDGLEFVTLQVAELLFLTPWTRGPVLVCVFDWGSQACPTQVTEHFLVELGGLLVPMHLDCDRNRLSPLERAWARHQRFAWFLAVCVEDLA